MSVQSVDLEREIQDRKDKEKALQDFPLHVSIADLARIFNCDPQFVCDLYTLGWRKGYEAGHKWALQESNEFLRKLSGE